MPLHFLDRRLVLAFHNSIATPNQSHPSPTSSHRILTLTPLHNLPTAPLHILIPPHIRPILRKTHRLEPHRILPTNTRSQALHNLLSDRCYEIRNREACPRHRFICNGGGDDKLRGKRDAVACGGEDVCGILGSVIMGVGRRGEKGMMGKRKGWREKQRTIAESLEHIADVKG